MSDYRQQNHVKLANCYKKKEKSEKFKIIIQFFFKKNI